MGRSIDSDGWMKMKHAVFVLDCVPRISDIESGANRNIGKNLFHGFPPAFIWKISSSKILSCDFWNQRTKIRREDWRNFHCTQRCRFTKLASGDGTGTNY